MRCYRFCSLVVLFFLISAGMAAQTATTWNKKNAAQWYSRHEWLPDAKSSRPTVQYDQFGRSIENTAAMPLRQIKPDASVDQVRFAEEYHARKQWWDKAFAYLQNTNFDTLAAGDYPVVGQDVYARVSEGPLKTDTAKWEAHINYIDIHLVLKGHEKIGFGFLTGATPVEPYNSVRDITFYTGKGTYYTAEPGTYFIAFPYQIHRPSLEVDGKGTEKKVVIKIRSSKPGM